VFRRLFRKLQALAVYRSLFARQRRLTAAALALNLAASAFEGMALLVLVPLISETAGSGLVGASTISDKVVRLLELVGIRPTLTSVIVVFALLGLISAACTFGMVALSKRLMNNSEALLRRELFRDVFRMRWSALASANAGELTKSFIQDVEFAGAGFQYLVLAIGAALTTLLYAILSFLLAPLMTLLALGFGLVLAPAFLVLAARGRRAARAASRASVSLTGQLNDVIGNAKFVLAQNLLPHLTRHFSRDTEVYRSARNRQEINLPLTRLTIEVAGVAFVSAYLYISLEVLDLNIAVVLVFLVVFYRLLPRLVRTQETLMAADTYAVWLANLLALSDRAREAVAPHSGTREPTFADQIELRDVTFHHARGVSPILDRAHLVVPRGSSIAIVGPSGTGKTTLLDLLTGLYEPSVGALLVDGTDLTEFDMGAWRDRIGFVLQDSPIFNASIRDNIVLDHLPVDERRLQEVCELAGVQDFVADMPDSDATIVGERGSQLSGGQRQRIALARALYREPWLLLLDEPTSALDTDTEARIIDTLRALKGRVTMVIVSHGAPILEAVDAVYRLESGRVTVEATAPSRTAAR
jgi:ATP-binding cassette subfamily C protein